MAAAPPSSLSYRTTGSACLHPLSQLLGIPLDQVSAARGADPSPAGAGGEPAGPMLAPSGPAPRADFPATNWTGGPFFEFVFQLLSVKKTYTLHDRFEITFFFLNLKFWVAPFSGTKF